MGKTIQNTNRTSCSSFSHQDLETLFIQCQVWDIHKSSEPQVPVNTKIVKHEAKTMDWTPEILWIDNKLPSGQIKQGRFKSKKSWKIWY